MSPAQEQARQEYVLNILSHYGTPPAGHLHVVREVAHGVEPVHTIEAIDPDFQHENTVLMLIPEYGDFLDGQCYDAQGYEVFAD
ncbi:hypothetical protein [Hymenobacter saemangeumensis]